MIIENRKRPVIREIQDITDKKATDHKGTYESCMGAAYDNVVQIIISMLDDDRLHMSVRKEYKEKLLEVLEVI